MWTANPVLESLTVMSAESLQPVELGEAAQSSTQLPNTMQRNRIRRLLACGFDELTARHISDLHTPKLM